MSSNRIVPLLFLNLGGEMMYILDQRLRAQNIPKDKALQVVNDIVSIMLNEKFMAELFKPQLVYNKPALRKLFEDLAHGSIMRLNSSSMDKLYELMIMAFKYQLFSAKLPSDVILITLNHLDALRSFVTASAIRKQVDATHALVMKIYGNLSQGELQNIRYCLLNVFQDLRVKVSLFLRREIQADDSSFIIPVNGSVPADIEVPGFIRVYNTKGDVIEVRHFPSGGDYFASLEPPGSTEITGNRQTKLGCNMYKQPSDEAAGTVQFVPEQFLHTYSSEVVPEKHLEHEKDKEADGASSTVNAAHQELNLLLAQLMRDKNSQSNSADVIRLNLFGTLEEELECTGYQQQTEAGNFVSFDARAQCRSAALDRIYSEMSADTPAPTAAANNEESDLLDLLDNC